MGEDVSVQYRWIVKDITTIDGVNADTANGPAYDLLGRQVNDTYHGIVIRDGKKMVQ